MANIPPVYKSQAHNNMARQRQAASGGSAGDQGERRQDRQPQEKKKVVLMPMQDSGTIYRPDGKPIAKSKDEEKDSRV